ncbi:MAG: hypothetical protein EOM05_04410 [Clostridia bacterium]|nr:hypothetical protein [Clostridia bacterium]
MKTGKNLSAERLAGWFKLDNAGTVFPGQNTSTWSNVFRMTAVLDETINPEILRQAVIDTLPRFPCFDVEMHRGLFWYYLEKNRNQCPPILPDIKNPCTRIKWYENGRFLFRVYYRENRISVEFYHALTDAYGVSRFLCTMVAQYLRLRGYNIPAGESVLDINHPATEDELEDAFSKFASSKAKLYTKSTSVYHTKGARLPIHTCNVTTGFFSITELKEQASKYNVTITEFIASIFVDILYNKQLKENKKQKVIGAQIPVNLRNSFKTNTLRNFSLCYQINLDPMMGDYTFEEIVQNTALNLRCINNPKQLNAMMTNNINKERNIATRIVPLFLKNAIMSVYFGISAESTTSVLFSNVGLIKLPEEMKEHVSAITLIPPHGIRNAARTAAVGYGDIMSISFTNVFDSMDVEKEFFTRLVKMGIHIKIESNKD